MTNTRDDLLARAIHALRGVLKIYPEVPQSAFKPIVDEYDALPPAAAPSGEAVAWVYVKAAREHLRAMVQPMIACNASDRAVSLMADAALALDNALAAPVPAPPSDTNAAPSVSDAICHCTCHNDPLYCKSCNECDCHNAAAPQTGNAGDGAREEV